MNSYAHTLLRNIGKVYRIPHQRSSDYKQIHEYLSQVMTKIQSGEIDRQGSADILAQLLSKFDRLPEREGRADERISVITSMLNPRNIYPKSILDIGAGTSDITTALKAYYKLPKEYVFAIDQKLPKVTDVTPLIYQDGKIPLPDNSIDLIIMFVVLHHVPPDVRPSLMAEIARVLSPEGVVIIRDHDNDNSQEFYVFLDFLHIFWYIASKETPDPLYLMTREETQQLFNQVGLESKDFITYGDPNPQRLYHEMYGKKPAVAPYKFADAAAQMTLQEYIDKIRLAPHTYESFSSFVPTSLQQGLIDKYYDAMQTNIDDVWPLIGKEVALVIILQAIKHSPVHEGISYITSNDIISAIGQIT